MADQQRPYAGQSWANGIWETSGSAIWGLPIIALDLKQAAQDAGITEASCIELWSNATSKGFFVGDTSSLPAEGWTKLATL